MTVALDGRFGNRANADGSRPGYIRPKDAATILILDRSLSGIRVLMGRRAAKDAFMPAAYVFPGGRVDAEDGLAEAAGELDPVIETRLLDRMRPKPSRRRARALALCAIRETAEETGILLGRGGRDHEKPVTGDWQVFREARVVPDLSGLRLLARAITPPGRVRRFDSRFFVTFADAIALAPQATLGSGELEDIVWPTLAEADGLDLPRITRAVIADLVARLDSDPTLAPEGPATFYRPAGDGFVREAI